MNLQVKKKILNYLSTASTEFQHFGLPISLNISFKSCQPNITICY